MEINAIPPPCLSLKQCVSSRSFNLSKILGGWFHVIINHQTLIRDKGDSFCPIVGVENTPASIGSPGADGGAVKFWISDGGGAGYLSKRPSDGPSSQTTAKMLEKRKFSPGTVLE